MDVFIGTIKLFAGNFAPAGWAFCDGSLVSISENDALFALIGTTYGGDGITTFALPDLRSRVPISQGGGTNVGQAGGVEQVAVIPSQLPPHTHALTVNNTANTSSPAGGTLGGGAADVFSNTFSAAPLAAASVSPVGGSSPHNNVQPYLALNYIISLFGIYPSQS